MNKTFSLLFSLVLFCFVVFIVWYIPSVSARIFALEDIGKSLDTSRGRERKQQGEYNQVIAEIPGLQEKLEEILPLLETTEQENKALKSERKELREQKQKLEEKLEAMQDSEETGHE